MVIGTVLIAGTTAFAQQQERKLIDRLLRPNMSMKNAAQDRKFTGATPASFTKPARTRSFYVAPKKQVSKAFVQESAFTPRQFAARHFRAGDSAANIATRSQLTKNDTVIPTPASPGTRVAPESAQTTVTREYPGSRPFLVEGKSQKALRAQDRPLTIEQVRELLNKSK